MCGGTCGQKDEEKNEIAVDPIKLGNAKYENYREAKVVEG